MLAKLFYSTRKKLQIAELSGQPEMTAKNFGYESLAHLEREAALEAERNTTPSAKAAREEEAEANARLLEKQERVRLANEREYKRGILEERKNRLLVRKNEIIDQISGFEAELAACDEETLKLLVNERFIEDLTLRVQATANINGAVYAARALPIYHKASAEIDMLITACQSEIDILST